MQRQGLGVTVLFSLLAICCSTVALAQSWPSRPVRWVVPYPPGGPSDVLARMVGQKLSERLGQPVVIDNKAGAGGNIGTDFVAKSAPDGYTIVLGNIGPISVSSSLYSHLPYDTERDLAPITLLMAYPNVLIVNPAFPAKSVKEFIQFAKAQATPVNYATAGVATSLHLAGELFARTAGIRLTHVPYKGSAPGLNDTVAGHVQVMFDPISSALPLIKGGRLRALAVTSGERSALLPDVPTVMESGLPGYDVTGWIGVLAPKSTPAAVLARLVDEFSTIMQTPDIRRRIAEMAAFVPVLGPEHFRKFIQSETVKWREVVQGANIKAE